MPRSHVEFSALAKDLPTAIHAITRMASAARLGLNIEAFTADLSNMAGFTALVVLMVIIFTAMTLSSKYPTPIYPLRFARCDIQQTAKKIDTAVLR